MQPTVRVVQALLLVLTLAVSTAPISLRAQGEFSEYDGDGLSYVLVDRGEEPTGDIWVHYKFTFGDNAAIPYLPYPEAMVVKVMSGSFALRVGAEDLVVVDPQGRTILLLDESGLTDADSAYPRGISDQEIGEVQDSSGTCTTLCVLPPEVTVRVDEGFTVYLPGYVSCLFCNISSGADAVLRVVAALPSRDQPFSWTQLQDVATPVASEPDVARRSYFEAASSGAYVGCR
jgi:hypothetical protein